MAHNEHEPNHVSQAVSTNNTVIKLAEELDVKSYIIAPCIVCEFLSAFGDMQLSWLYYMSVFRF